MASDPDSVGQAAHGARAAWSALVDARTSHLLVVDIQTRLGASIPAKVLGRVVRNAAVLLQAAALLEVPVSVTQQYPKGLGPLDPGIEARIPENGARFEKTCFSCTGAAGLVEHLQRGARPQIVLAGMEAHVCVVQTAFELQGMGYQPVVVEDAVCSRKLENYQNALARLQRAGAVVASTESIIFEWLRDSRHPQFKAISPLIR